MTRKIAGFLLAASCGALLAEAGVAVVSALYASIPQSARKVFFNGGIDDMSGSIEVRQGVQGGESA